MAGVGPQRRRRDGRGVATRIILLALVPVLGLTVSLGMLARSGQERLRSSRAMSAEIATLRHLAELHRSLTTERLMSVALVQIRTAGIDEGVVAQEFEVEPSEVIATAQTVVADQLRSLAAAGVLPTAEVAARLADIRATAVRADADALDVAARFDELLDEIGAVIDREALSGSANTAIGTYPLGASLARLHAAIDAYRFGALQLSSLSDVWFSADAARHATELTLAEYSAKFDRAMTRLRSADDPAIDQWATMLVTPDVEAFDEAVVVALSGDAPSDVLTTPSIVAAFTGAAARQELLEELVSITADEAEREARDERDAASDHLERLAVIGVVVITLTLSLAGWCTYSITHPLRRLIERTQRIRNGDLASDDRPLSGPHDLQLAAATVEQLVDNLRLLDAKATALARYDLDDPVLAEDLPGRLGSSLQQSTRVLRESITAREELQRRLWHAAHHDSLTGIANRSAAIEQLRTALSDQVASRSLAVLFIDLDDFKRANDAYGHAVGDEILRVVASRMRAVVRPSDAVGRLGGDEFMVVLSGVASHDVGRTASALARAERLLLEIRRPIEVAGAHIAVGACIGVAFATPGEEPSDVLARADLAVYQAKQSGTSIHVYDGALHREIQTRSSIEKGLAAALGSDSELVLHYQPIVDSYTGELRRVEALLRWQRPGHGWVSPEVFIPAAESSALIVDVDRWVLERAMKEAASWIADSHLDAIGVAVNVSGRHLLCDSFVGTVRDAVAKSGIDPGRVTLELTESVLVDDLERAAEHMHAVRELGLSVYVDDFGTGYTSIAHLHALPIDGIKIDRSFVRALPGARELTLVRTLIELGLQLGLSVIAEGVETEEQRAIVQSLGCESIQGFLVGRPAPAPAGGIDQLFTAATLANR